MTSDSLTAVDLFSPDGGSPVTRPVGTWADAKLYQLTDTGGHLSTFLSFGSKMMTEPRAQSCYRPIRSLKGKAQTEYNRPVFTGTWATPVAVEVTVVPNPDQPAPRYSPAELARLVEDLRAAYDHFGGWTTLPGPLHFASVLKQYVPDYDLAELEAEDDTSNAEEDEADEEE